MKAGNTIVKKCLVVLLAAIYLFIAVVYLFYLPKYSPLRITVNYTQVKSKPVVKSSGHVKNEGANVLVLVHRAYKSAIENKRELFSKLLQISLVCVFAVTGSIGVKKQMMFLAESLKLHRPQQYAYLSYCTLRI